MINIKGNVKHFFHVSDQMILSRSIKYISDLKTNCILKGSVSQAEVQSLLETSVHYSYNPLEGNMTIMYYRQMCVKHLQSSLLEKNPVSMLCSYIFLCCAISFFSLPRRVRIKEYNNIMMLY